MALRDAIGSLTGNGPFTVTRRGAGAYVDGYWIEDEGTTSETIIASVQPIDGETLKDLPAGQRTDEVRVVYTRFRLRTRTPTQEPDILTVEGKPWEVIRSEYWEAFGEAHVRAYIARKDLP